MNDGQYLKWEECSLIDLKAYSTLVFAQAVKTSYNSTLQNQPQKTLVEVGMDQEHSTTSTVQTHTEQYLNQPASDL